MNREDIYFLIIIILIGFICYDYLDDNYKCVVVRELPFYDFNDSLFNMSNYTFSIYYSKYEVYDMIKRGELKGTDNNISCRLVFE